MNECTDTKSRQQIESLNQRAVTTENLNYIEGTLQYMSGNKNLQIHCRDYNKVSINSDEVIFTLLKVINRQTDQIGELTDQIGELTNQIMKQAEELIDLKLKLNGIKI